MIYFTADCHFGHANIIRYCSRPFASVEQMDAILEANWNAVVQPKDDIYILGDFMFCRTQKALVERINRLNGHKYLIIGNHDKREWCQGLFEWVMDYYELRATGGAKFVLFHYPIWSWHHRGQGAIHLYGHVHQNTPEELSNSKALNVGVDVWGFTPVSMTKIINYFKEEREETSFERL